MSGTNLDMTATEPLADKLDDEEPSDSPEMKKNINSHWPALI